MKSQSTTNQAVLLTALQPAAIAVVRIAGPATQSFLAAHFSRRPTMGKATHGELRDGDRTLDDPVVVLLEETLADLCLHGGPWVVRSTLDLLKRKGFAVNERSDVSIPLELADASDELEAEVLAALPLARTELGVRVLLAQPGAWESLNQLTAAERKQMLEDRLVDRLLRPAQVAIAGPANVGKSTLANRLFGRERAITADLPGTTRDWVGEAANLNGVPVLLIDTPGIRRTEDPIEQAAIAAARPRVAGADVVLVVLDHARSFDDEQQAVLTDYRDALVVLNKSDCPPMWLAENVLVGRVVLRVSARSGEGVAALEQAILARLGCGDRMIDRPRCWTHRQRAILEGL